LSKDAKPDAADKTAQPAANKAGDVSTNTGDSAATGNAPANNAAANGGAANSSDANSTDANDTYATGEGSRCASNDSGAADFIDVLKVSSDVPEAERKTLADARQAMPAACEASSSPTYVPPEGIQSPAGKQFLAYLIGAGSFYAGDYATALSSFNSLLDSPQPWLKETSRYMIARTQLNLAQRAAFDQWGAMDLGKVDAKAVAAAKEGFTGYLAQYPAGRLLAGRRRGSAGTGIPVAVRQSGLSPAHIRIGDRPDRRSRQETHQP